MEKKMPKPMTPFDELVIPQQLHMLKLFLPYTPSSNQHFLGVFIKFLELKETIAFFQDSKNNLHTQAFHRDSPPSPTEMLTELKPYMPPQQSEMMDSFLNMMNIMEMMQMFQGNDGGDSSGNTDSGGFGGMNNMGNMADMFSGGFNPMDMMMGMMTPEQQNMFQMYNNMFASEMDSPENPPDDNAAEESNTWKGDDTDERMDEQSGNEEY